jgi:hypothetical protein
MRERRPAIIQVVYNKQGAEWPNSRIASIGLQYLPISGAIDRMSNAKLGVALRVYVQLIRRKALAGLW